MATTQKPKKKTRTAPPPFPTMEKISWTLEIFIDSDNVD
jgi:hypothetical protein